MERHMLNQHTPEITRSIPTIERDIPLPPSGRAGDKANPSIFRKMEVGDSVFFAFPQAVARRSYALTLGRTTSMKFTSRVLTEASVKGVRIWRTA